MFLAAPVRAAELAEDIDAAETTKANVTAKSRSEVVKVGWYEDSYHITGKSGNRSGYGYEYEQAVSAYTGWDYDYVTGNWEELLQEWLEQHGAIRVGYLENDPGFSAVNPQSGKLMGVVNDYIEYASKCFEQPLEFDLVGLDSQEALIQAARDNKIDMIFHVNQNPYYAEKNGLALSNTVLSVPFAAVTAQEAFDESAKNTVAIAKENSKYKWYVTYNYPDWNIKEYSGNG